MSMKYRCRLGLAAGILLCASAVQAATYTTLSLPALNGDIRGWTDGGVYTPLFPSVQTWNGVPFSLAVDGQNNTVFLSGALDIPVNEYGISSAYTIINSAWGSFGSVVGSVEFFGSAGAYWKVDLVEGTNVRDHYDGGYNNAIDNVNAVPAFSVGPRRSRLDMQIYTLPTEFQTQTLDKIRFTSAGGNPQGVPFLAAATVSPVPEPGTVMLSLAGLAILAAGSSIRRRNRML